jgi:hypothetical protein
LLFHGCEGCASAYKRLSQVRARDGASLGAFKVEIILYLFVTYYIHLLPFWQ